MKKNDVAMIMVVVIISAIFSFAISSLFISPASDRHEEVEVVGAITTEFPEPDKRFFNEKSLNPTLIIEITPNNNQNPFQQRSQ